MLEFRLIYQGVLPSNGSPKRKHEIRRYLHRQLVEVWKTKSPLKERMGEGYESGGVVRAFGSRQSDMEVPFCGKRFLPIVQKDLHLICALDILLLSYSPRGVMDSGDLDNRMKTLLDALCIPKADNGAIDLAGDEDPLYCLLQDDSLISELRVAGDFLFAPPDQIVQNPKLNAFGDEMVGQGHVCAVIQVAIKKTRAITGNVDF